MMAGDEVYEAERMVYIMQFPVRLTKGDAQELLDSICGSVFTKNRWPRLHKSPPSLGFANTAHGWYDRELHRINLPPWAQNDLTLIHELAHAAVGNGHMHDEVYCRAFLELVTRFMGKDAGHTLRHCLMATRAI